MTEQPSMLRLVASDVRAHFSSLPMLLLINGLVSYRVVQDDGWPWWLPIALTATAVGSGWLLGWRKAHKIRKRRTKAGAA